MWEGIVGKAEEDDPEPWQGFRGEVDFLYLGAIDRFYERERERDKEERIEHNTSSE